MIFQKKHLEQNYLEWGIEIFTEGMEDTNAATVIKAFAVCGIGHILERAATNLSSAYDLCESPIERAFLEALIIKSVGRRYEITFPFDAEDGAAFLGDFPCSLKITPQWKLKKYRADFLLEFNTPNFGVDTSQNITRRVIVECDGHDFHEKTKDQAKRDKAKDRAITGSGIPVLRYTGSEIYSDPFKAAEETLEFLENGRLK